MFLRLPTLQQDTSASNLRGSILQTTGIGIAGDYSAALTSQAKHPGVGQPQRPQKASVAASPAQHQQNNSSVNSMPEEFTGVAYDQKRAVGRASENRGSSETESSAIEVRSEGVESSER